MRMNRDHSIRVPVSAAELREAQQLAERLDMPVALLVRKMLRDAASEFPGKSEKGRKRGSR